MRSFGDKMLRSQACSSTASFTLELLLQEYWECQCCRLPSFHAPQHTRENSSRVHGGLVLSVCILLDYFHQEARADLCLVQYFLHVVENNSVQSFRDQDTELSLWGLWAGAGSAALCQFPFWPVSDITLLNALCCPARSTDWDKALECLLIIKIEHLPVSLCVSSSSSERKLIEDASPLKLVQVSLEEKNRSWLIYWTPGFIEGTNWGLWHTVSAQASTGTHCFIHHHFLVCLPAMTKMLAGSSLPAQCGAALSFWQQNQMCLLEDQSLIPYQVLYLYELKKWPETSPLAKRLIAINGKLMDWKMVGAIQNHQ